MPLTLKPFLANFEGVAPDISQDEAGMKRLFKQFSFPGGISSHVAPTTPGSIHEGGELGYSLSHAFGAAFDNPGLIVACIVRTGIALPYASAIAPTQTGKGSGVLNSCSFLGGTVGATGGGIASASRGSKAC
jgi:XFP-like protein